MSTELLYGQSTLRNLMNQHLDYDYTITIVRHSERPSFDNIPVEKQDSVTITQRGIEAARNFGKSLVLEANIDKMKVYHWGLKRCSDTADAIAAGASSVGGTIFERESKHLLSPIADIKTYHNALKVGGWNKMLHDWQATEAGHKALVPTKKYSMEIYSKLLVRKEDEDSVNFSVIAAHDLQIFPLLSSVFGGEFNDVGYLEGPVISWNKLRVTFSFGDKTRTMELSKLFADSTVSPQV